MVLTFGGERYEGDKAVKDTEKGRVALYQEDDFVVSFGGGITDFSGFELEGGEWSAPEPTESEKLRGDVDYCLMLLGEDEE